VVSRVRAVLGMRCYFVTGSVPDGLSALVGCYFHGATQNILKGPGFAFEQRVLELELAALCYSSKELSTLPDGQKN